MAPRATTPTPKDPQTIAPGDVGDLQTALGAGDPLLAGGPPAGQAAPPAPPAPGDPAVPPVAAAPPAPPAAEPPAAVEVDPMEAAMDALVGYFPDANRKHLAILMDACMTYGVDPDPKLNPLELAGWRYYAGQPMGEGAHVVIVTAGGLKLKHYADPNHPADPETENRLRQTLNLREVVVAKDGSKETVDLPLPGDLTLPAPAVTGQSNSGDHRYDGGYLRAGGKMEAARRAKAKDERQARGRR